MQRFAGEIPSKPIACTVNFGLTQHYGMSTYNTTGVETE